MAKKHYQVRIESNAEKNISKLPTAVQSRVWKKIKSLVRNPRPRGIRPVEGIERGYRIKVSDYRILYQINDREFEVLVFRVRHRSNVYRNL